MAELKKTIYVDGKPYEADPRQNLLHAVLSLGFNLPYFCWHPALGSVGACRQCCVKQFKDENDTRGRLVMACMTPASPGARISISDPEAVEFRAGIIEGMMLNHPHDCPVCDEGGECHLQDMTVMTGHNYRRTRFPKRTFRNQYLGPFLNHEMNRCIQCYRCVRFYRDYAGGNDLNAFAINHKVFFGRAEDGVLESEFAGNLVEVCPTGVFTDLTLKKHYTRKWDLRLTPSICAHCSVGCNISIGERYGTVRRVVNRFNSEVNGYFLCDRGRYGYEFALSEKRLKAPAYRGAAIGGGEAQEKLRAMTSGTSLVGIGSPRATIESNYALRRLVGEENFFAGVSDARFHAVETMRRVLEQGPARSASLKDVENSDAVLILGEDVTNSAPRMALSLRQSAIQQPLEAAQKLRIASWQDAALREVVQHQHGPFFIAAPSATRLDDVATRVLYASPEDIARLGFAVAHELDAAAPEVSGLAGETLDLARTIAAALKSARHPLVVSGFSCRSQAVIEAAANVAKALCAAGLPAGLSWITPEANDFGLSLLGARPLSGISSRPKGSYTLIAIENNLYRREEAGEVDRLLEAAEHVIVADVLANDTTAKAELLLPAAAYSESSGTLINAEGRAQRFFSLFPEKDDVKESWRWFGDPSWTKLDDLLAEMKRELPRMAPAADAAPPSDFRIAGAKVPREPHRYSGRTAMTANVDVVEPKPPSDPNSALSFTMEGSPKQPPSALQPFFWAAGWNSIQSVNKFQTEIGEELRGGDPGRRFFEPDGTGGYFSSIPAAFERRAGEWLVLPIEHIFGSEELSREAQGIAKLVPAAYVALNSATAASLGSAVKELDLDLGGAKHRLPLKILDSLPDGIAGVPSGLTTIAASSLPAWGRLGRAE